MANEYILKEREIFVRKVWIQVVQTSIGDMYIVQHENADMEIVADIFFNDLDGANKVFSTEVARLYEECKDKFVV